MWLSIILGSRSGIETFALIIVNLLWLKSSKNHYLVCDVAVNRLDPILDYIELTYCIGPSFPLLHKTPGCSLEDKLDRERKHWFIC